MLTDKDIEAAKHADEHDWCITRHSNSSYTRDGERWFVSMGSHFAEAPTLHSAVEKLKAMVHPSTVTKAETGVYSCVAKVQVDFETAQAHSSSFDEIEITWSDRNSVGKEEELLKKQLEQIALNGFFSEELQMYVSPHAIKALHVISFSKNLFVP